MKVRNIPWHERGKGNTLGQMAAAPLGAVFVWPTRDLSYPIQLAQSIGRGDLEIRGPSFLDGRSRGQKFVAIILDHACDPSEQELVEFYALCSSRSIGEPLPSLMSLRAGLHRRERVL